ncbi:hypothetical protein GCM10020001_051610 [Nonomuraea salmonea]
MCLYDDCYRRSGERGVAVLNRAVMLSPHGVDPVIFPQELTHVEPHARLRGAEVPQWFDGGPGRPGQRRPPLPAPRRPLPAHPRPSLRGTWQVHGDEAVFRRPVEEVPRLEGEVILAAEEIIGEF